MIAMTYQRKNLQNDYIMDVIQLFGPAVTLPGNIAKIKQMTIPHSLTIPGLGMKHAANGNRGNAFPRIQVEGFLYIRLLIHKLVNFLLIY